MFTERGSSQRVLTLETTYRQGLTLREGELFFLRDEHLFGYLMQKQHLTIATTKAKPNKIKNPKP